jgi:hypothetical protein
VAADFRALFDALAAAEVRMVVVGGVAVVAHGHTRLTVDLDICYARDRDNLDRLARALAPLAPRLRGAAAELPFALDAATLRAGLNFTLSTTAGDLDLFGEVPGVGGYREAAAGAEVLEIYGHRVQVLGLAQLENAKRAAGRAKDLVDLEAIRQLRRRLGR